MQHSTQKSTRVTTNLSFLLIPYCQKLMKIESLWSYYFCTTMIYSDNFIFTIHQFWYHTIHSLTPHFQKFLWCKCKKKVHVGNEFWHQPWPGQPKQRARKGSHQTTEVRLLKKQHMTRILLSVVKMWKQ